MRSVATWDLLAVSIREADMKQGRPNASHLYEAERRVEHAARPGFRILELQLSPTQKVPWHSHTDTSDTLYGLEGHMRLFLQNPKRGSEPEARRSLCD